MTEALERVRAVCLALPEAACETAGEHAGFLVRGRRFAWFLHDHHGDGVTGLVVKAAPGEAEELVALDPARFYRPAYLGARGWVGVRLDREDVDWDEVAALARGAFRLVAPKRLAAAV